jgi:hypothetical protein
MAMKYLLVLVTTAAGLTLCAEGRSEEAAPAQRKVIDKGLAWIAKGQHRDGHWEAPGGQYPTTMTSLSGMVLLMQGSTVRDGKYAEHIRKAADWVMDRAQPNGLIGNPHNPNEAARYMYGHGFGMLFLSQVYGEEEDNDRRQKLEGILTRAVQFTGKAQTDRGGWGYVSSADGAGFDEGSVTVTQVQSLRAARNAGIAVPKGVIQKAQDYLKKCTTERGGVIYSLAQAGRTGGFGPERTPLTAAAIACAFSAGQYDSPLVKKWIEFCRDRIGIAGTGGRGHDEYMHYYYAQALYFLGDNGYEKLFPGSPEGDRLTWSKYRKTMFDRLIQSQHVDGSWTGSYIGPVFTTDVYLTILQLDNGALPIYQR